MEQAEMLPSGFDDEVSNSKIVLHLPWPPTVNHHHGHRVMFPKIVDMIHEVKTNGWDGFYKWLRSKVFVQTYLKPEAQAYHVNVWRVVNRAGAKVSWTSPVKITATLHPPDRRKRDNSNLWKMIEDALESAGVVVDDNQFVEHHDYRREVIKGGLVVVEMELLLD